MKMSFRHVVGVQISALILGLALSWAPVVAHAQQAAPKGNEGFKATPKQAVDLGPEFDGMSGRQLRMRTITIAPGGHIGIHSHKDRPAVVYFLQGTDTVTFGDGSSKVFRAGDTSSANKDTTHWHRNDGTEPVMLVAVDIFHKAK
jgi:quercetin dioxygenase-like cupin family protein